MSRIALFPGSFNPFTKGHEAIVQRALNLFDTIVIAIGINSEKLQSNNEHILESIQEIYKNNARVKVISYSRLTADIVHEQNACCIIRGIRNEEDFTYENEISKVNYSFFNVETIYLLADPQLKEISSSVVRELKKYGKDISNLIP